ncbi:hypothetical protein [Candidatus Amarolinea aalborgensis]|uniref:hypothetical protein n=1 Tax=Candidatus Amarolinea aalborgensis TaxID=2249329 RepID=UPI003BF94B25
MRPRLRPPLPCNLKQPRRRSRWPARVRLAQPTTPVGQPANDALLLGLLAQVSALQQQNADLAGRLAALERSGRP